MKSIAVIGAGESGVGTALLAKQKELKVFVSDYGLIKEEHKKELLDNNIPFEEGGHSFEKIDEADLIVKSPGIPEQSEIVRYFRLRNKKIVSEIEFASQYFDGQIIGITGSNGKTTTTTLCHHILKHSDHNVGMGGNVGISFARLLTNYSGYDWVVLELSSFQLEDIQDFRVDVAVILNITPDHLDRYDYDFDKYASAKWNLVMATKTDGSIILNEDNDAIKHQFSKKHPPAETIWLSGNSEDVLLSKESGQNFEIGLKGRHNLFNASVCVTIARQLGMKDSDIQVAFNSFKAVEHRLEYVDRLGKLDFVNDSKSTNIDSCLAALDAMDAPILWIAGGTDKGNDYSVLDKPVREKVTAIICLTKDDTKLRAQFGDYGERIVSTQNVDEAVLKAVEMMEEGTVLLSPACASFDLFDNYEHRGDSFKIAVRKILNERD